MNIGYLNATGNGGFVGRIETLAFRNVVGLRPFQSRTNNPNAPKFDIMARAADGRTWVKIGAAFEQASKATGVVFYQGSIDDPSLTGPMNVAFFDDDQGGYNIAWTRKRPRRAFDQSQALPDDTGTNGGDGLGDSTADDAAFLNGATAPKGKRGKTSDSGDPFEAAA